MVIVPAFRPRLAKPGSSLDVAIVGCGAAGIAAARRCLAAGLSAGVFEARDRVGGRAVTASFAGHPVDLGAHWLHAGHLNPLVRLGRECGEPIRRAPSGSELVVRGRRATRAERDALGAAFERADRAFATAAREPRDRSLDSAFPPTGRWRGPSRATFALVSGRPLAEVSVKDFPSEEFGNNYFVRGGYGSFLARLADGLPVALGTPVHRIALAGDGVVVETGCGRIEARAAIVTLPTPLLAAGAIRFAPELPPALGEALASFLPGTYEHVVLNWPDAPFRRPDRLAKLVSHRASYGMMTRMDGAPFHYLELDHRAASERGRDARARLAREVLVGQFGYRALDRLRVLAVTDWVGDPWSRCAWAVVSPGRVRDRDMLARPVGDRVWFAGEANMRSMWGTVGGAWESGEEAAAAVAAHLLPRSGRDFARDGASGVFSRASG